MGLVTYDNLLILVGGKDARGSNTSHFLWLRDLDRGYWHREDVPIRRWGSSGTTVPRVGGPDVVLLFGGFMQGNSTALTNEVWQLEYPFTLADWHLVSIQA